MNELSIEQISEPDDLDLTKKELRQQVANTPNWLDRNGLQRCLTQIDSVSSTDKYDLRLEWKILTIAKYLKQIEQKIGSSLKQTLLSNALNGVIQMGDLSQPASNTTCRRVWKQICNVNGKPSRAYLTNYLWMLQRRTSVVLSFTASLPADHPLREAEFHPRKLLYALVNLDEGAIKRVFETVQQLSDGVWQNETLYECDWYTIERLAGALLVQSGYPIYQTSASNDGGVDLWVNIDGQCVACEVKHRPSGDSVGRPTLQKLASHVATETASGLLLITTGPISDPAKRYAEQISVPVNLISGNEFIELLSRSPIPPSVVNNRSSGGDC